MVHSVDQKLTAARSAHTSQERKSRDYLTSSLKMEPSLDFQNVLHDGLVVLRSFSPKDKPAGTTALSSVTKDACSTGQLSTSRQSLKTAATSAKVETLGSENRRPTT